MSRRALITGAAGRDFHNFNVVYRDSADHEVVAFTATQIPFIEERVYPALLAGPRYPDGIPIYPEKDLDRLIRDMAVDEVVFSYSDPGSLRLRLARAEGLLCPRGGQGARDRFRGLYFT